MQEMFQMKTDFSAKSICANLQSNYKNLLEEVIQFDLTNQISYGRILHLVKEISADVDVSDVVEFLSKIDKRDARKRKDSFVEIKNIQVKRVRGWQHPFKSHVAKRPSSSKKTCPFSCSITKNIGLICTTVTRLSELHLCKADVDCRRREISEVEIRLMIFCDDN